MLWLCQRTSSPKAVLWKAKSARMTVSLVVAVQFDKAKRMLFRSQVQTTLYRSIDIDMRQEGVFFSHLPVCGSYLHNWFHRRIKHSLYNDFIEHTYIRCEFAKLNVLSSRTNISSKILIPKWRDGEYVGTDFTKSSRERITAGAIGVLLHSSQAW